MDRQTAITRSELYDLIWSKPIVQLAKSYGLSDVGLSKLCQRYNIPRPPRGHWAKLQHGKKVRQTPLPIFEGNEQISLREAAPAPPTSAIREKATSSLEAERQPENRITVQDEADEAQLHPLVQKASDQLANARTDASGRITPRKNPTLDIITTKESLPRSLQIMNAIILALEERGYKVTRGPSVVILETALGFSITEDVETIQTPKDDIDLSGRYEFGHSRFKESKQATGQIVLSIKTGDGYNSYGCQRTWRDTKKKRLEERLNSFVSGLIEFAVRVQEREEEIRQRELEREKAEARRREEAQQRAKRREQYQAEKSRLKELLDQASSLQQSREVRELIEAVRQKHAVDGPIDPESKIAEWIEWATLHADRLDPLKPSPPSILDETHLEERERPYGYNRW